LLKVEPSPREFENTRNPQPDSMHIAS
jgi:hypothetical protein